MKIDFHLHTKYSPDSITEPKKLAAKAKKLGIIPSITDHNSIEAHSVMRDLGAPFIPGEEISTDRGDLVGLYVNELIKKRTPFLEAVDRIHEQGGLAYLPHMYDYGRSAARINLKEAKKVDIIEVFNARCLDPKFNEKALEFAEKNKITKAVGSDSHFLFEFGTTYNILPDFDIDDPKMLMKVLKKAKFQTKKGPIYARGTTKLLYLVKHIFGNK